VKLYTFDGVSPALELLPLAARRALDRGGWKMSLVAWQRLELAARERITTLGSEVDFDRDELAALCAAADPPVTPIPAREDPSPDSVPEELLAALGSDRPLPVSLWALLSPLDRYVLVKVASRGNPERLTLAYREIVGKSGSSTHVAPTGGVRMVSVSGKAPTLRRAVAESWVTMSETAYARLEGVDSPKGDVLATARLAGIQGAKRTADLIPLCHPLSLTHAQVSFEPRKEERRIRVLAEVEVIDRTGVEMEALVAASTAALTIYDMLKSVDRGMSIGPTRLLEKSGGRSGHIQLAGGVDDEPRSGASTGTEGGNP
jgi:cyclic pyranopterin phosphate synthase